MINRNIYRNVAVLTIILAGVFAWSLTHMHPAPPVTPPDAEEDIKAEITDADKSEPIYNIDDINSGYLILVNKTNEIDRDYKPGDLSGIEYYAADRSPEGRYMRTEAANAFHLLADAAREQGLELVVTTAYRSYGFQSTLYNNYVARDGQEAADKYSAQPGKSEHQTGLAADLSSPSVNYQLTLDFADTKEGQWLAENAHLFGFIIRYPEGKEDITGYQYEPWHIRYTGLTAAEYIYNNNITLEEYLKLLSEQLEE